MRGGRLAHGWPDVTLECVLGLQLSQSDEHRVTLHRVPLHMSGTFACEVSTDAPSFSTFVKKGQLSIVGESEPFPPFHFLSAGLGSLRLRGLRGFRLQTRCGGPC